MYYHLAGDEESGGFCAIPGSHLVHADLMKFARPKKGQEYVRLSNEILDKVLDSYQRQLICVPRYTLLLWDSRLVHCNMTSVRNTKRKGFLRMGAYICFTSDEAARTESKDKERLKLYQDMETTNHCPIQLKVKSKMRWPRKGFTTQPKLELTALNENQRALVASSKLWT